MIPSIAITLGDAAGIGPEIVSAALASGHLNPNFSYRVLGDCQGVIPGQPTPDTARGALLALEQSALLANSGEVAAVATGPIHKARMREIGFPFPGQTEFFAARSNTSDFAMLLAGGGLTVALVTAHLPLRLVPSSLLQPEIVRVGCLLAGHLFACGIALPRVAVAGLNPHAGESGLLGDEEQTIIAPAIAQLSTLWQSRVTFAGPLSPDTVFHRANLGEFDAVLCMYHDQGLIPLKLLGFDSGVNVTLGLPFIRTSPDHGTAFEIAGRAIASPASMIAAINLAATLALAKPGRGRP